MAEPGDGKEPNANWTADSGYGTFSARCPSPEVDLSDISNTASANDSFSPNIPDDPPTLETAQGASESVLMAGDPTEILSPSLECPSADVAQNQSSEHEYSTDPIEFLSPCAPVAQNQSSEVHEYSTDPIAQNQPIGFFSPSLEYESVAQNQSLGVQNSALVQGNPTGLSEEEHIPGFVGATQLVGANLDGNNPIQTMQTRLAEKEIKVDRLEEKLKLTTQQKEKAQRELREAKRHHEMVIATKNDEIQKLKGKVEKYQVQVANLQKSNYKQKAKYEEKIKDLKEELDNKEAEHNYEKLILEKEIMKNQLTISQMETKEECLKRELAQANEETAKTQVQLANTQVLLANERTKRHEEENKRKTEELEKTVEMAQANEKLSDDLRKIAERDQEKAQEKEKQANNRRRRSELENDKLKEAMRLMTERMNSVASNVSTDSISDM